MNDFVLFESIVQILCSNITDLIRGKIKSGKRLCMMSEVIIIEMISKEGSTG